MLRCNCLRSIPRPPNHYDSKSAANPFGQRAAATTELGRRFTAYLTKSDIHRIVRRPRIVRSDIAAVHGEQRPLLRLGESGSMRSAVSVALSSGWVNSGVKAILREQCLAERLSAWAIGRS